MNEHDDIWLRRFAPRPLAAVRLVCFPHSGGSAAFYRGWALQMPPEVELVAVQYPGRMERLGEPLIDGMGAMADTLGDVLARRLAGPFALFGHSMGAAVAFEVSLRLERLGRPPLHVFASARRGPRLHRPSRRHLASDEALFAYLHVLDGTDPALFAQPELQLVLLPILRSDFKLIETYRPTPGVRVSCPMSAFVGDRDPEVSVEEAAAWREATRGAFVLRVFAGSHFYLREHEQGVIAELLTTLGQAA